MFVFYLFIFDSRIIEMYRKVIYIGCNIFLFMNKLKNKEYRLEKKFHVYIDEDIESLTSGMVLIKYEK